MVHSVKIWRLETEASVPKIYQRETDDGIISRTLSWKFGKCVVVVQTSSSEMIGL